MNSFIIELRSLRFFADHGMYQEEMKVGNEFEVDIIMGCRAPRKKITSIEQTINYVEVYRILQETFAVRRLLLETLAMDIAEQLEAQLSEMQHVSICIRKLNPPITNFSGSVAITYKKKFKRKD
ncbi:MAG: dihydroneopterin aldolase [Chitinophagaceae bacterium]